MTMNKERDINRFENPFDFVNNCCYRSIRYHWRILYWFLLRHSNWFLLLSIEKTTKYLLWLLLQANRMAFASLAAIQATYYLPVISTSSRHGVSSRQVLSFNLYLVNSVFILCPFMSYELWLILYFFFAENLFYIWHHYW